jgi:hypothetical protein
MITTVNYSITRGLPWDRQISVKSRQTRWCLKVSDPNAYIQVDDNHKKEIYATVIRNHNILLSLNEDETLDLPEGYLSYDVWATVNSVYQPIAKGRLAVSTYGAITPLEDDDAMELRYTQRTDYRRTFSWKDEDGDVLIVQNAFMQAKDASGTVVLDIRWYNSPPSEDTIASLNPANRRGYLAPATGATLQLHISNLNTIASGSYTYDLFVKDSAGDWDQMVKGTLVVEEAVSVEPV